MIELYLFPPDSDMSFSQFTLVIWKDQKPSVIEVDFNDKYYLNKIIGDYTQYSRFHGAYVWILYNPDTLQKVIEYLKSKKRKFVIDRID